MPTTDDADPIDEAILSFLEEDCLRAMLAPPLVPHFAKETLRPSGPPAIAEETGR